MTAPHCARGHANIEGVDRSEADSAAGARLPFGTVDEVSRHWLRDEEPESVHIEVHLPGRPEVGRLKAAFGQALRRHPRILTREARGGWYRRGYEWELTGAPDVEPVECPPPGPDALDRARARALADCPPLTTSPPLRLEVITDSDTGDGSVLLLTFHHTALDVMSCLRVLATAAELYGGADNSPLPSPVRSLPFPVRSSASAPPAGRMAGPLPIGGSPWVRPARVAPEPRRPGAVAGNGLLIAELPLPHRAPGSPYTVNDQLLVATALMVARWNRLRDSRSTRPVRITMPVDDRPRGIEMPIGNGTRLVEVVVEPEDPAAREALLNERPDPETLAQLLRSTAQWTRALKATPRPPLGRGAALLTAPVLPVGLRAAVLRGLRRAAAPWTSTVLLSNIGRVPYPFDFGDAGRATAVWFSAPAHMPRGLTVTTAGTGDRLHLALRWSPALLQGRAAPVLARLFEESLAAIAELDAPGTHGRPTEPGTRAGSPAPGLSEPDHLPDHMPERHGRSGLPADDAGRGGNETPGSSL